MNTRAGRSKSFCLIILGLLVVAVLVGRQFFAPSVTPPAAPSPEAAVPAEPSAPTGVTPLTAPPVAPVEPPPKTVLQRLVSHDTNVFKLSPAEVQKFLTRNASNAESLLAAFNVTSDKEHLREALRLHPTNALVLATALAVGVRPEERRELLEQFKQAAPENPLADYLSARDHLKNRQPVLALEDFRAASGKAALQDFTVERVQGLEEMYLGAGYSVAEAKALAMSSLQMPAFRHLRELGRDLSALQQEYVNAGDTASAEALTKMGLGLAAHVANGGAGTLLGQMIGGVLEREFLNGLDPAVSYDFLAQPAGERLAQLREQDRAIRASAQFYDQWIRSANDAQLVSYFDRMKLYGETAALQWARNQVTDETPAP